MRRIYQSDDNYIIPENAQRRLWAAQKENRPVYLYGAAGSGKTSLIRQFFRNRKYEYYNAAELAGNELAVPVEVPEKNRRVVLDGLHEVWETDDRNGLEALCRRLLEDGKTWLLLISRAPLPGWLLDLHIRYDFQVIREQDLYLTREEQDAYLEQAGIRASGRELEEMWACTGGAPVAVRLLTIHGGDVELTRKDLFRYLDGHVYDQWDLELEQFIIATSIVDSFTKELAEMITGSSRVDRLLSRAMELGNFFELDGSDGVWKYRWQLLISMRQRLKRKFCQEKIRQFYHHAGLYYELHEQIPEALAMYETIGDLESVSRVLVENMRKNPASGYYYELKDHYLNLPEEMIRENPLLIAGMSMLQSMLMNEEESERWYGELEDYAAAHTGSERREAKLRLLYLDIGLPHRGSVRLAELLQHAGTLLREKRASLPELSVTSNLPSLMNGGKDFCEWSRHDRELAASIGKAVSFVLGKYGKGLVPLALAESFLEKGADGYEVMRLSQKGRMEAESGGKTEQSFVAVGILVWLAILDGNAAYAMEQLETFRKQAEKDAPNVRKNLDAFCCRIRLYQNDYEGISGWMEEAPDELKEFFVMERFRYLTKLRVYLAWGQYERACVLGEKLLYYAEKMKRKYIRMETRLLLAIAQHELSREAWKETLQACIAEAESYHFVRLLSREGPVLDDLLKKGRIAFQDKEFEKQVKAECRKMSAAYPYYLKYRAPGEIFLSDNARNILKLQADGLSTSQIAEKLGLTIANVKYHSGETYKKLGVRSRTAAVREAQKRNMI